MVCREARESPERMSPVVGLSVPGLARAMLISPLLRKTDFPLRMAFGSRLVAAVESRMREPPVSLVLAPRLRMVPIPGVTPVRVMVEFSLPETRTMEPLPEPGVFAAPMMMGSVVEVPVAVISEPSARVRLLRAARMMSLPIRGEPALLRVRLLVETVAVLFSPRCPPMRRLWAPKLLRRPVDRTS